ncbi:MAG: hypothetical protein CL489_10350 [Acidobacteria bacterium]|nr:hypothetical protein [Acidobacteriota bacterium]|tara:strand:+ start:14493 stop:15062 length:570 start_codon:yes stop_codon:yes gene_type:complete
MVNIKIPKMKLPNNNGFTNAYVDITDLLEESTTLEEFYSKVVELGLHKDEYECELGSRYEGPVGHYPCVSDYKPCMTIIKIGDIPTPSYIHQCKEQIIDHLEDLIENLNKKVQTLTDKMIANLMDDKLPKDLKLIKEYKNKIKEIDGMTYDLYDADHIELVKIISEFDFVVLSNDFKEIVKDYRKRGLL